MYSPLATTPFKHRITRAFTLIELLVVVAVIAILAAIALPNFLEAQVRAKVSRAKNDLRTLATGIEAYTVDNNVPPYDGEPGFVHYGWATSLSGLTTPVSYLSSLETDIFQDDGQIDTSRPDQSHFVGNKHSYDYATAYWEDIASDPAKAADWVRRFGTSQWKLTSAGPDLTYAGNPGSFYGFNSTYDPTNGTLSSGEIIRSQGRVQ